MTGPTPFFGLSCWPGAQAGASVVEVAPDRSALSVYLDPISLVLNAPPFPGGDRVMARFLRQVARSANALADQLDAKAEVARHALQPESDPEWFGPDGRTGDPGGGR